MNKNRLKIISVVLAISLTVSACGVASTAAPPDQIYIPPEAPTTNNEPLPEFYAGFTQSEEIPFLMVHQNGESLGTIGDTNSPIEGVVWVSSDGESSMVIYSNDDGLPQSAVVGEDVILYSNYTNSGMVDITILYQDGTSETFQAQLDTELLNKVWSFSSPSFSTVSYSLVSPQQPLSTDGLLLMKQGLYLLGAASCLNLVMAPVLPPLAALALPCAGTLIGGVIMYGNLLNMNVAGLESINSGLNMVKCASAELTACVNVFLNESEKQEKLANQIIANPPPAPETKAPVVTYAALCGWVENNSFTGALAPTFTIWETNEVVDLGALDSSKLRQFLNAGMPGYFQVFDPAIGDDFLLDFSYAKKVNSCSQTQTQPPTQSSVISSMRGTLCGQYIRITWDNPPGFTWENYIFVTSSNDILGLPTSFPSEGYYRVYDAVIDWTPFTFGDGTSAEGSITSWSGYEPISSLNNCSQTSVQPPAQSSTGTQAQISNEVYYAALRQSPGYSNKNNDVDLLANVPAGDIVQILGGPEQADGLNWWYVSWNGTTGWMADHTGSGKTILIFLP